MLRTDVEPSEQTTWLTCLLNVRSWIALIFCFAVRQFEVEGEPAVSKPDGAKKHLARNKHQTFINDLVI